MGKEKPIEVQKWSENELVFDPKIDEIPEISVKFLNQKRKLVQNFLELRNSFITVVAEITLTFFPRPKQKIGKGEKMVWLKLKDYSTNDSYQKNTKDALIKYIFKTYFDRSLICEVDETENENLRRGINFTIQNSSSSEEPKKIALIAKESTGERAEALIPLNNLKIYPCFYVSQKYNYNELVSFSSPRQSEPFWTKGKISFALLVLGIVSLLVYFYRKKIWGWIKREDKTTKKEQVEIF